MNGTPGASHFGSIGADGGSPSTVSGEPVLDRGFRLLQAFLTADGPLPLTALSIRADLPKSTTLRLARRLVALGALEQDEAGRYSIGLRMHEIAAAAPRGQGLRQVALPYMEDLHHATGQHVLLAVRDALEAVLVERLSAHRAGQVMYRVGGRLPLHATGVGLVLLAHAPQDVLEAALAGDLMLRPEHIPRTEREVREELAQIRREHVAVVTRPHPEPMTSVAAPVFSRGGIAAAISVVAPTETMDPGGLKPAVVAVSRAVSRALGSS